MSSEKMVDGGPVEDAVPVEAEAENITEQPAPESAPEPEYEPTHGETASEPPPAPEPPTPEEIDATIEATVGEFIGPFRAEHPGTYRMLAAKLGHPLEFEMTGLVRDAVYRQLAVNTDEAVDLGQIVKAIAEIVLTVAGRFLPMLG